ncbi:hypothetical protein [Natrialba taiwanensis]|uniref:Pyrrolo-quinoline quinone n=1 Tax=Natrialba taiwanensis DSM 12281 TaxID=1230458 RepID=L9ZL27_9EURY|nr:hypothetical protein [Natrialba taiwanensis]ELY87235.1 hypothetical protein C484_17781 [Natrialba taiwanensis DSM 12281]
MPPVTRRRLLATTAAGLATAVAGCGYQPGGGELDWERSVGSGDSFAAAGGSSTDDERWFADGEFVARVRNRSGRTFTIDGYVDLDDAFLTVRDSSGEVRWSGSADARYTGEPAFTAGRAYLHLEDGRVVALERNEVDDSGDADAAARSEATALATRWETAWDGPALALHTAAPGVDSSLLVGVHWDGLVGFDIDSGDIRFEFTHETFDGRELDTVVVAADGLWALSSGDRGGGHTPRLFGLGPDGDIRATVSPPMQVGWLTAVGSTAVLGLTEPAESRAPELRTVAPTGEQRVAIELAGDPADGTPIAVPAADRVYHVGTDVIEAIDVASGTREWRREGYSFRDAPVADADGIYGWGTGPELDSCGLTAVTVDGEPWWGVPPLETVGCGAVLELVGDRLVAISDGRMYGLHKKPGRRYTLFS